MKFSRNNKKRVFKILLVISSNEKINNLQNEYVILNPIFKDNNLIKVNMNIIHNELYMNMNIIKSWEVLEDVIIIVNEYNEIYKFKALNLYIA